MDYYVLEKLPEIHGALIGVGAAFISAFVMYGYDQLCKAVEQINNINFDDEPAHLHLSDSMPLVINADGQLDWLLVRRFFTPNYSGMDDIASARTIVQTFHYVFSTYPFGHRPIFGAPNFSLGNSNVPKIKFDAHQVSQIKQRLNYLLCCWNGNRNSIIELARRAKTEETILKKANTRQLFEADIAKMPSITENQKSSIWLEPTYQLRLAILDYEQIISGYFERVIFYHDQQVPELMKAANTFDTFHERFALKRTTLNGIGLFAALFVFGILVPLYFVDLS